MPYLDYGVSIPEIGGEANIWGAKLNDKTFPMLLQLMRGYQLVPVSGNMNVVFTNGDLASNGLGGFLNFTDSGLSSIPTITLPGVENVYFVRNAGSTYAMSFTAGGNTVSVPAGRYAFILSDGTTLLLWEPVATAGTLNAADKEAAQTAATSAASSAGTATTQKNLAIDNKNYAMEWAVKAVGVPVSANAGGNGSQFSALHYALAAAASAAAAALFDPSNYYTKTASDARFILASAIATTAQYLANTANKTLTTDQVNASGAVYATADGATITFNQANGFNQSVTLGGNRTVANISSGIAGRGGFFKVAQDGTGSRTLSWASGWDFAGGAAPAISTTAAAVDYIFYVATSATTAVVTGVLKAVA